MMRMVLAY